MTIDGNDAARSFFRRAVIDDQRFLTPLILLFSDVSRNWNRPEIRYDWSPNDFAGAYNRATFGIDAIMIILARLEKQNAMTNSRWIVKPPHVGKDYRVPFRFTGTIDKLTFKLGDIPMEPARPSATKDRTASSRD